MNIWLLITIIMLAIVLAVGIFMLDPVRELVRKKSSAEDYKQLLELAEIGVRWAKQWMQTATGEDKKYEVAGYLRERAEALGLMIDETDIDKVIEAVYEKVKKENEKAGNTGN